MNIKNVFQPVAKAFFKTKGFCIKNAPELMVGAGITTGIVATVLACKQTLKLDSISADYHADADRVHAAAEAGVKADGSEYTETDAGHDLTVLAVRRVGRVMKTYAIPVGLYVISVGLTLGGFNILRARHAAVVAAFGALQTTFSEYRERVAERYGKEAENRIYNNIPEDEVTISTDENGNQITETTPAEHAQKEPSVYSRFFDEYSSAWTDDPEYNKTFLRAAEKELNLELQSQGYLFLNRAYRKLGLKQDKTGSVCGWIYKPEDPTRDSYVSFGIFDDAGEARRMFVNGLEPSILLDFNVDGYIIDKI